MSWQVTDSAVAGAPLAFDHAGRMLRIEEGHDTRHWSFGYDLTGQLVQADRAAGAGGPATTATYVYNDPASDDSGLGLRL